jgi:hypothetical protein
MGAFPCSFKALQRFEFQPVSLCDLGSKTKAPTPFRRMGLVCFIMARANHHYPSGFGFIMRGRIFSLFLNVKDLGRGLGLDPGAEVGLSPFNPTERSWLS